MAQEDKILVKNEADNECNDNETAVRDEIDNSLAQGLANSNEDSITVNYIDTEN